MNSLALLRGERRISNARKKSEGDMGGACCGGPKSWISRILLVSREAAMVTSRR
jgi:hypothetical protein